MSIKSPSGRLARWALQIQSFNPKIEYTPGKANVLADMLSRPTNLNEDVPCDIFAVLADFPVRKSKDIRQEQLKDEELKKIIDCFENSSKDENFANWTSRGYLMNQGILYRYSPEVETEEAQLVVPFQERERVLQQYHDVPTTEQYGAEGTYNKVASRYYFPGMRKYIAEYVKNCPDCNRYKPSNQKPTGLLRTPVYAQRFKTLAIDLFGPLPETSSGKKCIFLVEDISTIWVELFVLKEATSVNCAKTLVEEVFLRYGLPRRLISDNGPQFISAVMQQTCNFLGIKQDLIPVYHPQDNPSERKNRDLKPRLAILVKDEHGTWEEKLPMIRFALNTAKCETTNHTAAFLQFGRELRTTDDVTHDLRALIDNDNFVDEITPYLKRFSRLTAEIKDHFEQKQDERKMYYDRRRRQAFYKPGDQVWVTLHPISKSQNKKSRKFMPKREGPYLVITNRSPTTYDIADPAKPDEVLGTYHSSALRAYELPVSRDSGTIVPLRRRGRPKKYSADSSPRRRTSQRGSL
ncbi:Transposon Tf2-6 polyprotein [Araneus ventricosus]|uniref:RNA-directed DNA polymerase n=1 Tax=Araneus ventricosus TaxID=182803 RepID=A0A4Y2JLC5_ARAVE|nr:Transposon Tf2-6 polyprotein [Araneus ventricosus]